MKKQFALLFTAAFLMTACDDGTIIEPGPFRPSEPLMAISSIYPTSGAPGSTVAIFGENFGATNSTNFVRFDSAEAEVTYVGYGILNVRVPMHLPDGAYAINVVAEGRIANTPEMFTVINSPDR
jgi:hypothetical protein